MSPDNTPGKDQDTHSKRIKFRKTETSRLKSIADETSENKGQVTLPTTPKPVPKAPPGRTSVVDPMALRDTNTSKVKRVQAAKDSSPLATVSLPGTGEPLKKTETVQLKVVQQKKKELDEEMSPASTVRLKSPAAGPSVAIPKTRAGAAPRDTMKISLPKLERKPAEGAAETAATIAVKPVPAAPGGPAETAIKTSRLTTPPATVKTSTTVLEKVKAKKAKDGKSTSDTAASVEETTTDATAKAAGGRTLKLKAGPKAAKTLKVKAEGSDKTVAVRSATSDGARTVKVEEPSKGLKFRARQQPASEAAAAVQPVVQPEKKSYAPGVLYTLGAAATLVAVGVTAYFLVIQATDYIF